MFLGAMATAAPGLVDAAGEDRVAALRSTDVLEEQPSRGAKAQLEDALRALKSSKRTGRIEAERALASITAFREARRNRRPPEPLESDLNGCVAAPTPECLLQEALAHAYRVPDEGRRDWALSAVATAYYEAGAEDRVYMVVALMDDPRTALRLLEQTVGSDSPAIFSTGHASDRFAGREHEDTTVWVPSAENRDWIAARREIESIAESRYRAVAWARLGRMAIDAGEVEIAEHALRSCEALIAEIEFSYATSFARYEAALTHIARVAHAQGGEIEARAAAAAAAQIDQPHFRADAFWRLAGVVSKDFASGILERAEASFAEIASRLRQVFVLTIKGAKSERRQDRALAIAVSISDPLDRSRAFTRLARYIQ